jgi:hypothetical protein
MICGVMGAPWPAGSLSRGGSRHMSLEAIVRWENGSHLTLRWSAVLMRKLIALRRFIRRLGRGVAIISAGLGATEWLCHRPSR